MARRCRAWGRVAAVILLIAAPAAWWWVAGERIDRRAQAERVSCDLPDEPATGPYPGMVWVPAGSFDIGDTLYREEWPRRRVRVEGFWMDRTEVTNDEFAAFVKATNYVTVAERPVDAGLAPGLPAALRQPGAVVFSMPGAVQGRGNVTQWWHYTPGANWRHPGGPGTSIDGRGSFPVVAVTLEDALAYARWKGRSLPSEAQWEWAARAARPEPPATREQPKDANTWQGLFPVINSGEDGFVGLAPVGCFAPNPLGLYDMIGNVWELTADAWTPDHGEAAPPPPDQVAGDVRAFATAQQVIKGGSFLCAPNYCMRYRAGARQPQDHDLATSHLGFRTILAAPGR